jgi:hypothetical protein
MNLTYRLHAIERMFERRISDEDVNRILFEGKVIEEYKNDQPYPSKLILGFIDKRPIHIVAAENKEENQAIIITVYEPSKIKWDEKFERRIK